MKLGTKSGTESQNLRSEIAFLIKNKIIEGILNPGDRVVESQLARELGISQTPIREAIHQLVGEHVVEVVPNRGALVRTLSAKDIFEIYSYRAVLEGMAIRLAVQNVTIKDIKHLEDFYCEMKAKITDDSVEVLSPDSSYIHHYIYRLSNHSILLFMYEFISFRIQLVNRILQRKYTKENEVSEHLELIEVLKKGDSDEAEKVMRAHIYRSYQNFVDMGMFEENELAQNKWI